MAEPQALIADRYRLLYRVGSGGMGVVWEGWDERLERRVATHAALSAARQHLDRRGRVLKSCRKPSLTQRSLVGQFLLLLLRLLAPHAVPVFDAVFTSRWTIPTAVAVHPVPVRRQG